MRHAHFRTMLLLLIGCFVTLPSQADDGARAKETAHLKGQEKALADMLIAKCRAGWEAQDFETYRTIYAEDARRTWGRSEKAGPHDAEYKIEDFLGCVKIMMSGRDLGNKLEVPEVRIKIDGDRAVTHWKWVVSYEVTDYRELIGERIILKRIDGQWKIIDDRSWVLGIEEGGKKTRMTEEEWERRDREVDRAARSGDLYALTGALMRAYRSPEAYDTVVRITQQPEARAIDWSQRGFLASISGHPDDVYPSFKKAQSMDPDVWLPLYAQPREDTE